LNEEYNVGSQYTSYNHYNDLHLVPNGEAGGARESLIREKIIGSDYRTYMRSTIKREAAAIARYPKN